MRAALARVSCVFCMLLGACDEAPKQPTKPSATATAAAAAPSVSQASSASAALAQQIQLAAVSDGVLVNGVSVLFQGENFAERLAAQLAGKANVVGAALPLSAPRSVKFARISQIALAVQAAKASGVTLATAGRDGKLQTLTFGFAADPKNVPACAVVAYIGKDVAITTWPIGGGGGKRFAKGMAGPDLTLGSEQVRKSANACTAQAIYLAADDSIQLGLVLDLALAARDAAAVPPMKLTELGLLRDAAAPARKQLPL